VGPTEVLAEAAWEAPEQVRMQQDRKHDNASGSHKNQCILPSGSPWRHRNSNFCLTSASASSPKASLPMHLSEILICHAPFTITSLQSCEQINVRKTVQRRNGKGQNSPQTEAGR